MSYCYLLITCHKTSFVVDYCLESMKQVGLPFDNLFVSADYDCDFGTAGTILVSGNGFIEDCKEAVTYLSGSYNNVILILDDFIFSEFDENEISRITMDSAKFDYLRLTPSEYVRAKRGINQVPKDHPYYSSLQVAIWKTDYLLDVLNVSQNIWEVEKQVLSTAHFFTREYIIKYRHVVEKGKWDWRARRIIEKQNMVFNSNGVQHQYVSLFGRIKFYIVKCIFNLIGYRFLR